MSLAKKMQQGGTTPNLYSFYGKQYDYNDLAQAADQGLNEYLATLKRGEKDSNDFRTAYSNIMSGIKDGSITFDNGQFHDSKGRYTNSDKKNKDYYGLIANYIYGKMGQSGLYKKPEETPWDASTNVKKALMQEIYNSDTPNLQDFLDLDAQKDGVRAITNRSARLANAFQSLADNWDTKFSGYSDDDRNKYRKLFGEAATALRDGTIDPGDYLTLSRAVGDVDFREMMATGTPTVQANTPQSVQATRVSQTPQIKTRHASLADSSYNPEIISRMTSIMSRVPTKGLINILRNSLYNRNYRFGADRRIQSIFGSSSISSKAGVTATLNALGVQGLLKNADPDNPNLFYIPGMRTKKGTAWVWDKANNTITEMPIQSIPYLTQQIPMNKQGGILYANTGAKVPDWRDNFTSFDPSKYTYEWGDQAYGMDREGNFLDTPFRTTGAGYNQNRYTTDSNYRDFSQTGRDAALAIENSNNYKAQTDKILSDYDAYNNATDKSIFNEKNNLFLRYSKWYDSQQSNAASRFWNQDKLNTSWSSGGNSYYGNPTKSVNDIKERIRNLRNDQMVSLAHNNFKATGKRYFYIDKNGVKQWVDPEVAKNYKIKEGDPTPTQDGFTTWSDYELIGAKDTPAGTGTTGTTGNPEGSEINPIQQPQKQPSWWEKNKQEIMDNILPLGAEASRLALSLRTNNKIADVQKKAINPVLKSTYELYSPVTGAFSEMQFRNRQAADVRRQAAQPYTSDASLNAARSLDANRQATDLEYQGFLADDKEIQRTKQEALKRQEDNIARRTDVANFNRASINQANREKADIEAQRLNANHQGVDNFIANNIVAPLKEKAAYNLGQRRLEEQNRKYQQASFDMAPITRQQEYQKQQLETYYANEERKIYKKHLATLDKVRQAHANDVNYDIRTSPEYQKYEDEVLALRQQKSKDAYDMANYFDTQTRAAYDHIYNNQRSGSYTSSPFTFTPDSTVQQQNWYKRIKTNKRGGKLSLTTQYLLNKVIK